MFSRSRIRRPSITSFRRMGAKVLRGEGAPPRPVVVHEPHVGVGESARQEEHGLHREGHNSEGNVRPGRRRESSPSIPFEPFSRVSCFGFPIENSARISSSIPQARTCGSPTGPWKRGRCTDAEAAAREGPDPGEPALDEVPSGQLCGPQPLPSDEHLPDGPFSTTSGTLAVGKEPRSPPSLPIRAEDQSAAGVGLSPRSEWRSSAYRARRLTTPRRGKIRTSSKAGKMLSDSITLTTRT